jgi:hypothetical protein
MALLGRVRLGRHFRTEWLLCADGFFIRTVRRAGAGSMSCVPAVADYHRSGVGSFSGFLLQDMYGAMVAHQMLSVVIGLAAGLAGGAVAYGLRALTRSPVQPAP